MKTILAIFILLVAAGGGTMIQSAEVVVTDYDWPRYANDPGSSKYADLDQINADTVQKLQTAWVWESPDNSQVEATPEFTPLGFKSTPIKIGDVLYISTSLGRVVALDAVTGKEQWVFDTETWKSGRPANMGFNHRGVAYWEDGDKRRILMGTNNAYLWSLDADTGLPDKTFGDDGRVDLTVGLGREVDRSFYSVVAAPVIVGNTVILGSVVFDLPVYHLVPKLQTDLPPGHIRGFDVTTGEQKWIFHSIPWQVNLPYETTSTSSH